jgi:23S rRNA-/tRNA-specific pseudouridylate synthase
MQLMLFMVTTMVAGIQQSFLMLKSSPSRTLKFSPLILRLKTLSLSTKAEDNQTVLPKISYDHALKSLDQWKISSSNAGISDSLENIVQVIDSDGDGVKAAVYLSDRWFTTKSKAYHACKEGRVTVNGRKIYASKVLLLGDKLEIEFAKPVVQIMTNNTTEINNIDLNAVSQLQKLVNFTRHILDERRNPPLHILYEDNDFAVVFKPSGIHSMKWIGTMKKQLFALDDVLPLVLNSPEIIEIAGIGISDSLKRPLPCHRLDARVSGCLLIAKTQRAMADLSKQFEFRYVKKEYAAILAGNLTEILLRDSLETRPSFLTLINSPEESNSDIGGVFGLHRKGKITDMIDGFDALTELRLVDITSCSVYGALTTVILYPKTGRRHQLRRHMAVLGCPIIGDDLYHDAACLPINERLMAIQAVSVGTLKSEVGATKETDDREEEEGGLGLETDRGKDEGQPDSYSDKDNYNKTTDFGKIIDPSFTSSSILSDSAFKASTTTREVRKGVGIFLVCTALDFYHPLKTLSGALPKDLSLSFVIGQDIDKPLQMEQQLQQNQELSDIDDRVRVRVECEVGPRFARLKEKAQKGYDWNVQSKGQLQ